MSYYIVFEDYIYSFNKLIHLKNWYLANQDYQSYPEEHNGTKLGPYLTFGSLTLEVIDSMKESSNLDKQISKTKPKKLRYRNKRR